MDNTPDSPAKTPVGYTTQGGNFWTLITPEIWKVLHAVLQVHERIWRRVRERDWFDRRVWLHVPVRRMDCHHCGARVTERIGWLSRHARLTERPRVWVETLAELLPIAHVAKLKGLYWHTIKEIDKAPLQRRFGNFEGRGVRRLVMNEFALHKGHLHAQEFLGACCPVPRCGQAQRP
jgi:transposase